MKGKRAKTSGCGENMIRGQSETGEQYQMILSICYQTVLVYEIVMLKKRPVSMNTLMKVLKVNAYLILMMR